MKKKTLFAGFLLVAVAAVATPRTVGPVAGLKFKIGFAQPLDSTTVTAGDRIMATLRTGIPNAAPQGTQVTARIVRVERVSGKRSVLRIEASLESVEIGGAAVPLHADANPGVDAKGPPVMRTVPLLRTGSPAAFLAREPAVNQPRIGTLRGVPSVYVWEFADEKPGFVVPAGLESSWVTN